MAANLFLGQRWRGFSSSGPHLLVSSDTCVEQPMQCRQDAGMQLAAQQLYFVVDVFGLLYSVTTSTPSSVGMQRFNCLVNDEEDSTSVSVWEWYK
jgi:hypothetical protein